jgi:membrane-bound metal-dependent hydrolase YbcI (DUF457 family)
MNLHTHVVFGILVGALFFGRPEIMLMIGVGSAIPDLDREYGFSAKSPFVADKSIARYSTISCASLYSTS